ncbi:MAG: SDR family oxidoreductase [Reyranellaceae bacterium]
MAGLKGKIAWVTGAGTGIGRAGAIDLAKAGAHVVLSGRSRNTLEQTARRIARARGKCSVVPLDVSDRQAVERAAAEILKRHKRIDILVNSAGLNVPRRAFVDVSAEGWDQVVGINLNGTMYCVMAVLPQMRKRKDGLIVNVSSWAGKYIGKVTGPAYNASKFGVVALTETINAEEGANGIRACCICPGEVATPIMDRRPVPPSAKERARMLQEEDLGAAIAFVASLPARACVNEIIISPTWNRTYVGGFESNRPGGRQ